MGDGPRLAPISDDDVDEQQRTVLERLRRPDGEVLNIFRTLAHHPDLLRRWLVFGNHVLAKSTLSPRVRELAILRTGWRCGSEYEFGQHILIALEEGITEEEIARVQRDELSGWAAAEAAALRAADELHATQTVGDDAWADLGTHYSVEECLDLIFTVGQYTLVSMALNTLRVQRDPGVPGFAS